jgi:CBS domain-containing protein
MEDEMMTFARDLMTSDPVCCTPDTTLDRVAQLMANNDCGEIPVVDAAGHPIGVITDRDIVCRAVANGKNPVGHTAAEFMSRPVVTVGTDAPIAEVLSMMEKHQIRRVPVLDADGCCAGIIAQADIASNVAGRDVAELVREVSRESGRASL